MKPLAMLVGIVMAAVGLLGFLSPHTYVRLAWFWENSPGLYIIAAIQLVVGIVLIRAAPTSKTPLGLGALGVIALIEAVFMPLMGHGRAHVVADWWTHQSPAFLRMWGLLELAVGTLVAWAAAPRRHELRPAASA